MNVYIAKMEIQYKNVLRIFHKSGLIEYIVKQKRIFSKVGETQWRKAIGPVKWQPVAPLQ